MLDTSSWLNTKILTRGKRLGPSPIPHVGSITVQDIVNEAVAQTIALLNIPPPVVTPPGSQTLVVPNSFVPGAPYNDYTGYVGVAATPSQPLSVVALGAYLIGNGAPSTVYLLDAVYHTVITSAVVTPNGSDASYGWYYADVTASLIVGQAFYLVVAVQNLGAAWAGQGTVMLNGAVEVASAIQDNLNAYFALGPVNTMFAGVDLAFT
jgi:hypothetical protein